MDISVIIPTYKPGGYIRECLESLMKQTLAADRFEVIVVVNGCNEPYKSHIRQHLAQWPDGMNTTLLQTDTPGVSNARNMGIDNAQGCYLAFVDDDDWVSPDYLQNLLAKAGDGAVVASNVMLIDENSRRQMPYFLTDAYKQVSSIEHPSLFTARRFLSPPVCKLIPRAMIGDDRFPTDFALGEDSIFVFTITKRLREVRFADADTVYYVRYRDTSVSHRHYDYPFRIQLALRTTIRYTSIYLKSPLEYNFMLFLSRVAATLLKLLHKSYQ